jgi:glyoxylase-like metal-dependent hydrolase (beta-lactamase superfamily II)
MNTSAVHSLPIAIPGHENISYLYLVVSERYALIDTGPGCVWPMVKAKLNELGIDFRRIDYILATHIHLDHLGGLSRALEDIPSARVVVHPRGLPHLIDPRRLWEASLSTSGVTAQQYLQPGPVAAQCLIAAQEGQMIDLGGTQLEVILTPGHAPHHLSFFEVRNRCLFAGESAGIFFPDGGPIRPAARTPFDPVQSLLSLEKMLARQPETIHYAHYGVSSTAMPNLQQFREALDLWQKVVKSYYQPGLELTEPMIDLILDDIFTRDGSKGILDNYSVQRRESEQYFLGNNVRGYWDYFNKNQR